MQQTTVDLNFIKLHVVYTCRKQNLRLIHIRQKMHAAEADGCGAIKKLKKLCFHTAAAHEFSANFEVI